MNMVFKFFFLRGRGGRAIEERRFRHRKLSFGMFTIDVDLRIF